MERELSELSKEIKSIRCHSETTEKTLLERVDKVDQQLSCLTIETERLCTSMKSTQKDLTLTLERLSRNEAEGAQLTSDLEAFRVRSEDTQKHLTAQVSEIKANLEQLKTETGTVGQLRSDLSILKDWTSWFDSPIVTSLSPVFDEFRGKRWMLLWRGNRDGFSSAEFHRRCDGHANTLMLILDTNGNVFGGFTTVEWDSTHPSGKCDDSLKSFLFTLKNPHNVPARRFVLKAEQKQYTIRGNSKYGPIFGKDEIVVCDNGNAGNTNWNWFGTRAYTNDTGLDGQTFFTGKEHFTVKEIEVFKITV
jgi:hypothetical protein